DGGKILRRAFMREPEDAPAVRRDLDRHAFAHAAKAVEQVMGDELEVPRDRSAVAERPLHWCALARGFCCRASFRRGRLRRFLRPRSLLRDFLASSLHSTLPA